MKSQLTNEEEVLMFKAYPFRSLIVVLVLLAGAVGCGPAANFKGAFGNQKVISYQEFSKTDQVPASPECKSDKCKGLRSEFRYVVYVGKQIYCYWDEKKAETQTDFDALAKAFEGRIIDGTKMTQYIQILREWGASFHDGHVNAILKDDRRDFEIASAPVRLEVLAPGTDHEKLIVASVQEKDAGVSPGDEVISVDGVAASAAVDASEKISSGSTRRMRRWSAARRIVDVLGIEKFSKPLVIELKDGDKTKKVEMARKVEIDAAPGPTSADTSGIENLDVRVLANGLGYLRIDGFSGTQLYALLAQAMDRLVGTRGLLLDLRKNGGGNLDGNAIIARLISAPVVRYKTSPRMAEFTISQRPEYFSLPWTIGDLFAQFKDVEVKPEEATLGKDKTPDQALFSKPVVALTSPNCFSACDTFVAGLKANNLATVVGEGTGGGTGTPLVFELPVSGNSFRYSVVRGHTAKDAVIEGNGTLPDVVIEPTQEERKAGKDIQLKSALAELLKKVEAYEAPSPTPAPAIPAPAAPAVSAREVSANDDFDAKLPQVWEQTYVVSPTTSENLELKRLSSFDELN